MPLSKTTHFIRLYFTAFSLQSSRTEGVRTESKQAQFPFIGRSSFVPLWLRPVFPGSSTSFLTESAYFSHSFQYYDYISQISSRPDTVCTLFLFYRAFASYTTRTSFADCSLHLYIPFPSFTVTPLARYILAQSLVRLLLVQAVILVVTTVHGSPLTRSCSFAAGSLVAFILLYLFRSRSVLSCSPHDRIRQNGSGFFTRSLFSYPKELKFDTIHP